MKVTKITYARVFNLGNYENERIEAEAEVEYGAWNERNEPEDVNSAMRDLREWVLSQAINAQVEQDKRDFGA